MDITTNTKRFTNGNGFAGATNNDLLRIAAEALDYAGEISECDAYTTTDIKVAYCVFGKHYRTERTKLSSRDAIANVTRRLRLDNEDIDGCDDQFRFEYDGMTFTVMTEETYNNLVESTIESFVEDAECEFERISDAGYLSQYVKFDRDMFQNDLMHDVDSLVSSYDGQVHWMTWNQWGGPTAPYTTPDTVVRRGDLFMIRED